MGVSEVVGVLLELAVKKITELVDGIVLCKRRWGKCIDTMGGFYWYGTWWM